MPQRPFRFPLSIHAGTAVLTRLRRPVRVAGALLLLGMAAVIAAHAWLAGAGGQRYAQEQLTRRLSAALGYDIAVEGLRISFPFTLHAARLTLADTAGLWLQADGVALRILPGPRMHRRLVLHSLEAAQLRLLRLPAAGENGGDGGDGEGGGPDIALRAIRLASLILPPRVTGLPQDYTGTLTGSLRWSSGSRQLELDLASHMRGGLPRLENAALAAAGRYSLAADRLVLSGVTLAHPALQLRGDLAVDLAGATLQGGLTAALPDLGAWSPALRGRGDVTATLSGPLGAVRVAADLTAAGLHVHDRPVPAFHANATATLAGSVTGTLAATAGEDITLTTAYGYAAPDLTLRDLTARYRGAGLTADAVLHLDTRQAQGELRLTAPDIGGLTSLLPAPWEQAGKAFKGALTATAQLSTGPAQQARIRLEAAGLSTPYGTAGTVAATARFADLRSGLPEEVTLAVTGGAGAGLTLSHAGFAATRSGKARWQGELTARGARPAPFRLTATGQGTLGGRKAISEPISEPVSEPVSEPAQQHALTLSALSGSIAGRSLSATGVTLRAGGEAFALAVPRLIYGGGRYALAAQRRGARLEATLKGSGIAAADLLARPPPALRAARAALTLSVQGDLAAPDAQADIAVTGLALAPEAAPAALSATAALAGGALSLEAALTQAGVSSRVTAAFPLRVGLDPLVLAVSDDAALRGTAKLALETAGLASVILPPPHSLAGRLTADLTLGGTFARPRVAGPVSFTRGRYRYPDLGVTLEDVTAHAQAQDGTLTLRGFSASDGDGHTLSGTGALHFSRLTEPRYEARFTARRFTLLRHPHIRSILSGTLEAAGDAQGGVLTGRLENDRMDISLPDRLLSDVPELTITRTIPPSPRDPEAGKRPAEHPAPRGYPLALDVAFAAAHKVFVRGRGVDAELQGALAVTGSAAAPEVSGKLSTIRGRYEEFGRQFRITKAELAFIGDIPPSPFLDVRAHIRVGDADIRPVLTGPLLAPELTIESTPAMPQEEALSRLLFGTHAGGLSAFQAVQLANSMRRLSGHGGGPAFDPLGRVRSLIGVDDITLRNNARADPAIGIGKYIGDRVYLEVEGGASEAAGRARVEVEVTPRISVESVTGATGAGSIGVNWKKDY